MSTRRKQNQLLRSLSKPTKKVQKVSGPKVTKVVARKKVEPPADSGFKLDELTRVGYITLDERGTILESNRTAAMMLRADRPALLRTNFSTFIINESRKRRLRRTEFAGMARPFSEVQLRRLDGTSLVAQVEGIVFGSTSDRRCRLALIYVRETGRQKAGAPANTRNQNLHSRNEVFHRIGDQAPVMIWMTGPDKLCTWVNRPWLEFTGRTMQDELGNGWADGIHPEDMQGCLNAFTAAFDRRQSFTIEYRYRRHDGQYRWMLDHGTPLYQENGDFAGYIGSCSDATEGKQVEDELHRYRKDLRTMASELLLAEERERQRLAESLHDGPSQALFRARLKLDQLSLSEPRAREISTILEDIGKMLNTMTFELSPVVLRTLGLRHAIRSLAGDMQQRYGLSIKIQDDGKEITLDERVVLILFRSVRELLINIVKHARTAKATLSIKKVDNRLQIAIEDRGKGFDLGEQSGQVERGHFGLFSIRERLAYLGGSFNVRSAPGKGTSVTLNAPLLAQAAAAHSNQAG